MPESLGMKEGETRRKDAWWRKKRRLNFVESLTVRAADR